MTNWFEESPLAATLCCCFSRFANDLCTLIREGGGSSVPHIACIGRREDSASIEEEDVGDDNDDDADADTDIDADADAEIDDMVSGEGPGNGEDSVFRASSAVRSTMCSNM